MGGLFGGGSVNVPPVPPPPPAANPATLANPQTQQMSQAARARATAAAGGGFDSTLLSGIGASAQTAPSTANKSLTGE